MLPTACLCHSLPKRLQPSLLCSLRHFSNFISAHTSGIASKSATRTRTHARSLFAPPGASRRTTSSCSPISALGASSSAAISISSTSTSSHKPKAARSTMYAQDAIIAKLPEAFDKARASGDLLFFPSTVHKHSEHGVEFEIRLCPALQDKPPLPTPHFDGDAPQLGDAPKTEKTKPDPFAPPYVPNLFLGEVRDEEEGDEYAILFNKYSVVPHHILMVTKEFRSQTAPLVPPDLVQAYIFLIAAQKAGRKFFAFYNCGDLSGASQPHKHLQLIPIEDDGPPVERLARRARVEHETRPFTLSSLPYANHVYRLPNSLPTASPASLHPALAHAFLALLDATIADVRRAPEYPAGAPSYNVVLTLEHMHLVPRVRETHTLAGTGEALSVNALGFAGMLLVKSEREMNAVKEEGVGVVLRGVALEQEGAQEAGAGEP
ncbi:ATP adenylyltransferase-domain-containing protein [Lenzites betulinus]|nr:ATP adenylyltransferase-domain-containing protein [Lenzites betulinus]